MSDWLKNECREWAKRRANAERSETIRQIDIEICDMMKANAVEAAGIIAALNAETEERWRIIGELQDEITRLRSLLPLAVKTIEGLSDQQAWHDGWYEQPLAELRQAIEPKEPTT